MGVSEHSKQGVIFASGTTNTTATIMVTIITTAPHQHHHDHHRHPPPPPPPPPPAPPPHPHPFFILVLVLILILSIILILILILIRIFILRISIIFIVTCDTQVGIYGPAEPLFRLLSAGRDRTFVVFALCIVQALEISMYWACRRKVSTFFGPVIEEESRDQPRRFWRFCPGYPKTQNFH